MSERAPHLLLDSVAIKNINIFCGADESMEGNGIAANNEIFNVVIVEQL